MSLKVHPEGTPLPANSPLRGGTIILGYFKPPKVEQNFQDDKSVAEQSPRSTEEQSQR